MSLNFMLPISLAGPLWLAGISARRRTSSWLALWMWHKNSRQSSRPSLATQCQAPPLVTLRSTSIRERRSRKMLLPSTGHRTSCNRPRGSDDCEANTEPSRWPCYVVHVSRIGLPRCTRSAGIAEIVSFTSRRYSRHQQRLDRYPSARLQIQQHREVVGPGSPSVALGWNERSQLLHAA